MSNNTIPKCDEDEEFMYRKLMQYISSRFVWNYAGLYTLKNDNI